MVGFHAPTILTREAHRKMISLRTALERAMADTGVTGSALAVIAGGALTEIHTIGELEDTPVQPDTIWAVASLTKPVFVYGVMQLVEQGVIDLDLPLQSYLRAPYLDDDPRCARMTARHAMTHSTGFPNWRDEKGLRAEFEPGSRFSYSSEGLTYLQYVVEQVTDMPAHDYLRRNVFDPLAMRHSALVEEGAVGLPPHIQFRSDTLRANGALSLRTTIEDYAQFMLTMLADTSLSEMLKPQIAVGDISNLYWGLGWGLQTGEAGLSFWHWGARGIPRTMNFALGIPAQRKAIVIFTNHANGLYVCQNVIESWLGESGLPAFEWLLPAQTWRPDGKRTSL